MTLLLLLLLHPPPPPPTYSFSFVLLPALSNFATPAIQEKKLRDMFRRADLDQTGDVNRSEFRAALAQLHFAEREADVLFDRYDNDNSGAISYSEFSAICRQRAGKSKRRFKGSGSATSW